MYNTEVVQRLASYIGNYDGIGNKKTLETMVQSVFGLVKDRNVFYCDCFAIRFCQSKYDSPTFSNVVLSLSKLQKYDYLPFIVCLVTPSKNYLLMSNATFLNKISHSSKELTVDNIKGSFLGSNIMRDFEGVKNMPDNFEFLFSSHQNFSFSENLERLVEATNNITPIGKRFIPTDEQIKCIKDSVDRAAAFVGSREYNILNEELGARVRAVESCIAIAAFIENVNLRGRIIEYLITAEDDLKSILMESLLQKKKLPEIFTADELGDYGREFECYITQTDIKTKVLFLSSNPKGYNIDKLLSFLAEEKSVYLVYIVAIDKNKSISTRLCSMYNRQLLKGTRVIHHWAGRNSRGVTQYDGRALEDIVNDFDSNINVEEARDFIWDCIKL